MPKNIVKELLFVKFSVGENSLYWNPQFIHTAETTQSGSLQAQLKRTRTHLSHDQEGAYLPDWDQHSLLIDSAPGLSSETATRCQLHR